MATLHIEHPISDFGVWKAAFDGFAEQRANAGVLGHRILRPVGDANYVVVELEFQTSDDAQTFLHFLQSNLWNSVTGAPALAGAPHTRILEPAAQR